MIVENVLFWIFAGLSVTAALGVVFHRSVIYAALFLIVVFFSIAGVFVLNNADFLAVAQAIVYGVGLTIVLLFGVMFTGDRAFPDDGFSKARLSAQLVVGALLLAVFLPASLFAFDVTSFTPSALVDILVTEGTTGLLGQSMFNKYALPFEVASVLLLLAMVGAIILAKKSFDDDGLGRIKYALNQSRLSTEAEAALEKATFQSDIDVLTEVESEAEAETPSVVESEPEKVGV